MADNVSDISNGNVSRDDFKKFYLISSLGGKQGTVY